MKRRKTALAALAALALLLSACMQAIEAPRAEYPAIDPVRLAGAQAFGQPRALVSREGSFSYVVLYPDCRIPALDTAIGAWAQLAVQDAVTGRTLSEDSRQGGDLMVCYETHQADEGILSAAFVGQYASHGSAPAVDYIKVFHYSVGEDRLLEPVELFPYTGHPQIFNLIEQKLAALNPGLAPLELGVNAAWLETALLTETGVDLLLGKSSRHALAVWPERLTLSYDELGSALLLPGEAEAPPAAQAPPAEETPPEDIVRQADGIDPEKPMLALTFDDGPHEVTAQILELLERHNVPATFFMIGRQVEEHAETVAQMALQGCELGSHTWDHPNLSKLTEADIQAQLDGTAEAIEAAAGVRPVLVRPPYGEANRKVRQVAEALGLYLVNWSVDTRDWQSRDAQTVYEHMMQNARDGSIILCHDLYPSTCEAVAMAIPALIEQGYQLVTVGQLLGLEEGRMTAGALYRHR